MTLKASTHRVNFHRAHLVSTSNSSRSQVSKRRSNRMSLNASVGLSGEDRKKASFTLSAKATNLNRHGATVQLSRDLSVGTVIMVRNQRGMEASARVVAQTSAIQGVSTYGIEFVEQDDKTKNFWGIIFPSNA